MAPQTFRQWLLMIIGLMAVGLGILGIFLPLLPTTPFLLLAAACFIRSSDRLYQWLLRNRWFGPYIRDYREHRGIPRRAKVIALILLWTTMTYSVLVWVDFWVPRAFLLLIACGVSVYLVRMKTIPAEKSVREPFPGIKEGRER